ncbi:hypothetical protein [Gorillibacterium massiliense]|uniref:hypothetical protein n=1 Tax=Gorillibacterium massiliense TaxID=1280390 RepID=UPI0004AD5AE6|nr:hypothetical protein [Gorillibacterium massiliense]
MAHGLETEFVKTFLDLTEAELDQFIRLFRSTGKKVQVNILENGNRELEILEDADESIVFMFQRKDDHFLGAGPCTLSSQKMANTMRKAIAVFKGDAVVRRVYNGFAMIYEYSRGSVVRIGEERDGKVKLIYEYKETRILMDLEKLFFYDGAEREIELVTRDIDSLLDLRNSPGKESQYDEIDEVLMKLSERLYALESL